MKRFSVIFLLIISQSVFAKSHSPEKSWGLGMVVRSASIPFDAKENKVDSVVPVLFYEGTNFFLRGIEGGAHLFQDDDTEFNVLGRMRFVDIPAEFQNQVQADTFDLGLQWRKNVSKNHHYDVELFSDLDSRPYASISSSWYYDYNNWEFLPKLSARYKSADFNNHYYALSALTQERVGAGIDANATIETRYHVASNFYLVGSAGITGLDNSAYKSKAIDKRWQSEFYLGIALFNDKNKPIKNELNSGRYLRIAHGWATPSDIGEILSGNTEKDEFNNQLTSVFYGHPLTDELFSLPIDLFLTTGFVWHWSSDVQDSEQEYQLGVKAYYTIPWPVRWRLGFAEGISYISDVTYIEKTEMEEKGYNPSKLMNALDFSIDINLGDIFNAQSLHGTWLGWGVHHRSSIFESASQFGRIKGGSNYNTIYIQFDF